MADAHETLLQKLKQHERERDNESEAVSAALSLLDRVDRRKADEQHDRRMWDLRADFLEETLIESRGRFAYLEQRIAEIIQKLNEDGKEASAKQEGDGRKLTEAIEASTGAQRSVATLIREQQAALDRILTSAPFKLKELPLQDFALAKLFLDSTDAKSLDKKKRDDLIKRIKIFDRRAEREQQASKKGVPIEDRRRQILIRNALDKCMNNKMDNLTLGEIDLLMNCCELIAQQDETSFEDDRLLHLLNKAMDDICRLWSRMQLLQDAAPS